MPRYYKSHSTTPIIAVYGEAAYRAVEDGELRLFGYEPMMLPDAETGANVDLTAMPGFLRGRPIVIWPLPGADGLELARAHAAALANGIASAVGIAVPPAGLPGDFELGDELPQDVEPDDFAQAIDDALRKANLRALPNRFGSGGLAVASWPYPPSAAAMFGQARAFLARYLAETRSTLDTIVLWCLHAWCLHCGAPDLFDVSPRLVLQANDARADHARALRLVAWLTPAPRIVSRTAAAHLLPELQRKTCTLLFDDVAGGTLYQREMRTLIAAGASSDGAFLGAKTKRNDSGWASCFAPAAIATAIFLPEDLRLRAIVLPMSPVPAGLARERLSLGAPPADVAALRAQMFAFAMQVSGTLPDVGAAMPRGLSAAARENWQPLFALAHAIGSTVAMAAIDAAQALGEAAPASSSSLALLRDIRDLVAVDTEARLPTARLIEALTSDPERPWGSVRRGRKLDARDLAERLSTFGVKPVSLRMPDDVVVRGYRGQELTDAFARYLGNSTAATSSGVVAAA